MKNVINERVSDKHPIKKDREEWTLLDRADELIEDGIYSDLHAFVSEYVDEYESLRQGISYFTIEDLAEISIDLDTIAYCLQLARRQGKENFVPYFKYIQRFTELSNKMTKRKDRLLI